ncbi:MAG TPA: shikimate kinase, partial [Luteimonas sp.]|nr:shikimate kinase [Luteimonas sp.]
TGGGAVVDPRTRRLLRERGFVVHLHIDVPRQLQRLARDRTRPLLAADDREQVLRRLAETRDPLYAEVADLRFDTASMNANDTVARLGHLLDLRWQMAAVPAGSTAP